jgi:MinD superfamily P-loop ATPase
MVDAQLGVAQESSGKLVTTVRNQAAEIADLSHAAMVIGDGPPGVGCPAIASLAGVDLAVVVTEPSVSAVHDLQRVLDLADQFRVPVLVVINKADISLYKSEEIEEIARARGLPVAPRVVFDPAVYRALSQGRSVVELHGSRAAAALREAWASVCRNVGARAEGGNSESRSYSGRTAYG